MATRKSNKKTAKKAANFASKHPKLVIAVVAVLLVIIAVLVILYFVKPDLYHKTLGIGEHSWGEYHTVTQATCGASGLEERECKVCGEKDSKEISATGEHNFGDGDICSVCSYDKSSFIGSESEITQENTLSIHFIAFENDKAGDCTLIKYGNTEVLIDAGSRQNSATTIKKYLDKYCTDGTLEYVIATHADQDHIAAFVGTSSSQTYNGILYSYKVGTVIQFDRTNKSMTTDGGARSLYGKYCDAVDYAAENGASVYTASQCWYNRDGAKRTYYLDTENKISLNILYNYYYENSSSDENNYSVCMLLTQQYDGGANNYLFTGDLEAEGEAKLVEKNDLPEVELFKGGHHGSPTSSNECLLSVIKPKHVAVCCCAGTDEYTKNPLNQFPSQDFINRVSKYTDSVYCTNVVAENSDGYENMNGNIVFYCEGDSKKVKLWCSNNTVKLKDTEWFKANRSTENTPWA